MSESKLKTVLEKKLLDAAQQFKELSNIVGGHEAVKSFFDNYGTTAGFRSQDVKEVEKTSSDENEKKDESADKDNTKPGIELDKKDKSADKGKAKPNAELGKALLKDHKIDTSIRDRSKEEIGLPTAPEGYGAAHLNESWNIDKVSTLDNPVTLTQEQWHILAEANKFYHGFVITKNGSLRRARFPAFELRTKAGSQQTIPDFEVFDSSSITIKETSTSLERSMAENGFTSEAIQAAVSGGYGGYGAAVSGVINKESSTGKASGDFADYKAYTAAYTFPRARVFLDQYNLKIDFRCSKKLSTLRDLTKKIKENIDAKRKEDPGDAVKNALAARDKFLNEYGYIFATSFHLGGQLVATKSADSIASQMDTQKRDAMKISAAASLSAPSVSGSISYSKEKQNSSQDHDSTTSNVSALAWSAHGGNTLLCVNPPEWANSLAAFSTWRVVGQETVSTIPKLISQLRDEEDNFSWSEINDTFQGLRENAYKALPKKPRGTWDHSFKLQSQDGRKIVSKDGQLKLVSNQAPEDEVVFTMLNADIKNTEPVPKQLMCYADNPVFLVTTNEPARDPDQSDQIPGVWVDESGNVKTEKTKSSPICRWSLRSASTTLDFKTPWTPNKTALSNNQEVQLFCHSYGAGSYREIDHAPYWAPTVCAPPGDDVALRVQKFEPKALNTTWKSYRHEHNLVKPNKAPDDTLRGRIVTEITNLSPVTILWEFLAAEKIFNPGNKELDATDMEFKNLLAAMREYDVGQETPEQLTWILGLGKVIGVKDPKQYDSVRSKTTIVSAVQNLSNFGVSGDSKEIQESILEVLGKFSERVVKKNVEAWQNTDPKCQEVKFKIKFV